MISVNTVADQCDSLGEYYSMPYFWGAQCDLYLSHGFPHFEVKTLKELEEEAEAAAAAAGEENLSLRSRRNLSPEPAGFDSNAKAVGATTGFAAVIAASAASTACKNCNEPTEKQTSINSPLL